MPIENFIIYNDLGMVTQTGRSPAIAVPEGHYLMLTDGDYDAASIYIGPDDAILQRQESEPVWSAPVLSGLHPPLIIMIPRFDIEETVTEDSIELDFPFDGTFSVFLQQRNPRVKDKFLRLQT